MRVGRAKMRAYIMGADGLFLVMLSLIKQCVTFWSNWVQCMLVGKRRMSWCIRAGESIHLSYDKIKSFVLC